MKPYLEHLHNVEPYTPGEQPNFPDMVKLNTNECPYPPSPRVADALRDVDVDIMRLYPDPITHDLNAAIANVYGVAENQVFTGVGSDDVLAMIFQAFFQHETPILFPDITYAFYPVWCKLFDIPYQTIPLNDNFQIQPADYMVKNGGIVFPNPNAPTGLALTRDTIASILDHNRETIVVIDEAYIDFGAQSAVPLLKDYDNLIIVQTFSKSRALAGARIGFALGAPDVIAALHDVKFSFNSYTINRLSLVAGVAAVNDIDYLHDITQRIIETREWTKQELQSLGFTFPNSKANFLFVTHPDIDAVELFNALREKHIYVRHFDNDRLHDYLRITIGTPQEMEKLFAFLRDYLA